MDIWRSLATIQRGARLLSMAAGMALCVALPLCAAPLCAAPLCVMTAHAQGETTLTVDDLLVFDGNAHHPQFSTGPEEKIYLQQAVDADGEYAILRQKRFPGADDAVLAHLVYNKRLFTTAKARTRAKAEDHGLDHADIASPDVWLIAAHYPVRTGHADVDAFLKEYAARKCAEMASLPLDPQSLWHPETWLAAQSPSADAALRLLQESWAATRRHALQGKPPPRPASGTWRFPYSAVTTYVLTRSSEAYLSVVFTTGIFWGGASSHWSSTVLSFDMRSGRLLQADDLFIGTDAQRQALKAHVDELARRAAGDGVASPGDSNSTLRMERMALSRRGLLVLFSPGERNCFGCGGLLLTLPPQDLEAYGVNGAFWQKR